MAREEAAPTFDTWRRRLEAASRGSEEVERFLQVLRTLGTPMVDGSTVTFVYHDPRARHASVVGEFNQWGRGERFPMERIDASGIFHCTLKLAEPARLEYKLVVDGEWKLDPLCQNSVDNGIGGRNSFFVVGEFNEPPELRWVEDIPHGRVEHFELESQRLGNRRAVHVYLPVAYEAPTVRLPALYVHDGGEYLTRASLPVVLDNLIHERAITPIVAVMVDPVDRIAEYMMDEGYADFVALELLPQIDGRFRTLAAPEERAVMGASLGGLISVYLALTRPELFSRAASQSGAFLLAPNRILALARKARAGQSFYFDVGKYEPRFIPAHVDLLEVLKGRGCRSFFQELAGGHNWSTWRGHLKELLTFLWPRKTKESPAPHRERR